MLLSIGMIVKNEEKYLNRCLTALKPILDNIDSELIIADTGSTDSTVEIAKKYTDNVYHFEWCDDFAKARNSTLERAKGEWYMFLDADEILEDAGEIIDFFSSGKYKEYNCANINFINYTSIDESSHAELYLYRLYKILPSIRFVGSIHEYIPLQDTQYRLTTSHILHYGYSFESNDDRIEKSNRNISLMLKLINTKHDTSALRNQLADSYSMAGDYENVIIHCNIGLENPFDESDLKFKYALYLNLINAKFNLGEYIDVINISDEYFKSKQITLASDIDVYYLLVAAYFNLCNYQMSIDAYNNYIDLITKNNSSAIITCDTYARALMYSYKNNFYTSSIIVIKSYIMQKKFTDALNMYKENNYFIDNDNIDISQFLLCYFDILKGIHSFIDIIDIFNQIIIQDDYDLNDIFTNTLERFILNNNKYKNDIIKIFCHIDTNDKYCLYMKIRNAFKNDIDDCKSLINSLITNTYQLSSDYYDLVYYTISLNLNLGLIRAKMKEPDFTTSLSIINNLYHDHIDIILNYKKLSDDINESMALLDLYYNALSYKQNTYSDNTSIILTRFINVSNICFNTIYKDSFLSDSNIILLSKNLQFAYFCSKAYANKQYSEELFIKYLSRALNVNKDMSKLISSILDDYKSEKNNESIENTANEFDLLANQIKNNIVQLINDNRFIEARQIINEYKQINPNDKDIEILEKQMQ